MKEAKVISLKDTVSTLQYKRDEINEQATTVKEKLKQGQFFTCENIYISFCNAFNKQKVPSLKMYRKIDGERIECPMFYENCAMVAARLGISVKTIDNHLYVLEKLGFLWRINSHEKLIRTAGKKESIIVLNPKYIQYQMTG